MAKKFKKTILVHYVFVPSTLTGTSPVNPSYEQMQQSVEKYKETFAFNIDGLIERFVPSLERSGIEVFNLENEYE